MLGLYIPVRKTSKFQPLRILRKQHTKMSSSKSSTSNPSSAFSSGISHHGSSSNSSLGRPSSDASIPNPTRQSKFSISSNSNNVSAQQQMSTPPNFHSNNVFVNKPQRPIRFPLPYRNVFAQKSTTVPSSYPIISTGQQLSELQRTLHVGEVFQQIPLHNEISPFVPERSWTHRQFSSRLSEVKPEKGSWPSNDAFQTNMDDKDINIAQRWVDRMGEKNKGRLYEIGQLDAQYTAEAAEGSLKHQPFTSNSAYQSCDELIALSSDSIIPNDLELRGRWVRSVISRANPSTSQL
ncbi:uncharacterized protein LOC124837205 [Vigna umbellata]|uniref:uncharacterized protein LOC124837205 n=1 Tax=Vigna umbellata TaxID=87088 RepID=UPI001F5E45E6|nr:uncharacterized protein LOC124837205 [Vigna umbellata]